MLTVLRQQASLSKMYVKTTKAHVANFRHAHENCSTIATLIAQALWTQWRNLPARGRMTIRKVGVILFMGAISPPCNLQLLLGTRAVHRSHSSRLIGLKPQLLLDAKEAFLPSWRPCHQGTVSCEWCTVYFFHVKAIG